MLVILVGMAGELAQGLHESLLTTELLEQLEGLRAQGWLLEWKSADDDRLAEILARHVYDHVLRAVEQVPTSVADRRERQVALVNRVVQALATGLPPVDDEARLLLEVKAPIDMSGLRRIVPRPGIPLRDSVLLVNGHRDLQIGHQVALEIQSADRIDLLCAFVRFAGVRLIRAELQEFLLRGGQMRVIASVYTGSTEKRALDELVGLGAKVKVSYETSQTRLHAKAWLFERLSGFHTAYVGSSNLTHSALLDGLEWNVRATQVDNPRIIERISATFEQYWNEPEFESYHPHIDGQRLQDALAAQAGGRSGEATHVPRIRIDVAPKPFQVEMLEALSAERQRGHLRNLVVAPTGTGKTWVSAFDYKRLRAAGFERLLFIAHRDEILRQSQEVFQLVLGEVDFGERHVGAERPVMWTHVFASIQSLVGKIDNIQPDAFDVVIVDEFHHAEAPTYRRLLGRLQPKVLVGLTATPERADGREILHWFDERIGTEMRLWEALDQGLLCPFHYLGVHDGTDLSGVAFERGRYVTADLEGVLTGDHVRARRILDVVDEWVLDSSKMRALGFCAGVRHAQFMAEQFTAAGLPSVALDGNTDQATRIQAVERLRRGELRGIFTVDIFNEGVDIPEVDTILLLRPTESATVFLQQLGRGLRWADGKSVLTVLDFVGQAHAEYRFDIRYRAMVGGTRQQIAKQIEAGFPLMPSGCAIRLDEIAQQIILDNVRSQVRSTRRAIVDDLRGMHSTTTLAQFLDASAFDLADVYSSSGVTFASARRAAGHIRTTPDQLEQDMAKRLATSLHIDDDERFESWRAWLTSTEPPSLAPVDTREGRLQLMLFAGLGFRNRDVADMSAAFADFWRAREVRFELVDLLDVLRDRARLETKQVDPFGAVPIHSHATYGLYEIIAAYGLVSNGKLSETREGVKWAESAQSDLLFITLNKSDEDYSPTTRYADYPISLTRFHWESQSKTAQTSPIGQRYINHVAQASRVILFVRENKQDQRGISEPYVCLGAARHVSHESDRPIKIVWELERPMPAEIYQRGKLAAG
jgi:superfamily II DNA or RNA helicase